MTLVIPCIAPPRLIPHPVTVQLLQTLSIGKFVCGIGPVPIRCLWIEVQSLRVMHTMHSLNGLLDKGWRRPAPRFQISQYMDVVDMHRSSLSQLLMRLTPRSARLVCRQTFTCVFRHGIDVGIEGQALLQHPWSVSIVRTQHNGRQGFSPVLEGMGLQSVLNTWNNGFLHPCYVIINSSHCLAQAYQQTHIGIFLDKGGYRLARIVTNQGGNRAMAVLCLQAVMVGKGLTQYDIIKHLNDPDATTISLMGQEREHFLVLLKCLLVNFQRKRIVLQFYQ